MRPSRRANVRSKSVAYQEMPYLAAVAAAPDGGGQRQASARASLGRGGRNQHQFVHVVSDGGETRPLVPNRTVVQVRLDSCWGFLLDSGGKCMSKGTLVLLIHGGTENWSPERWKARFEEVCRDRHVFLLPAVALDPAEVHY